MSHLQCYNYAGFGERSRKDVNYSQAVRIDNRIEISGQPGLDPETEAIPKSFTEEIEQAFSNVELALKSAGGKGWSQVYRVRMYVVLSDDLTWADVLGHGANALKKWCPDHAPLLTGVEVKSLALEGMRIEVEANAHLG
ncbi:putative translation initiation inhibitor [Periconia macrospinosa]|uniref:Putative translation initiation inhibitor n=1 Tax=Periconia macrospinosa TaxID=97972 RepID=A0A2V1DRJ1_9PLEO|nr:putative translation initiation inhibitor [Periconia macrospinosa]